MIHVELLQELALREKDAGIFPEPEVDLFMKVIKYITLYQIIYSYYVFTRIFFISRIFICIIIY